MFYLCASESRKHQNLFTKANPSIDTAIKVWNHMEEKSMRLFMLSILPGIKTSELIHLPKLQDPITLENIVMLSRYDLSEQNTNN